MKYEVERMKEVANCPICKTLFVKTPYDTMCRVCQQAEQEDIKIVTNFIQDRKYATIDEIHIETGVRYNVILKMLHRGTLTENGCIVSYPCSSCGIMITQGISCAKCVREIEEAAHKVIHQLRENGNRGVRMYSLDGKNEA
jgi:hypothetical protein